MHHSEALTALRGSPIRFLKLGLQVQDGNRRVLAVLTYLQAPSRKIL